MADFWTFDDASGDLTSITSGFTAIQINSKGKILSGGKDLSTIFLGGSSGGGSGNTAVDTLVIATSANWNTGYNAGTAYIANSANYALTNQNVTFSNNVTINGSLTALGSTTLKNTIISTTSALSVINTGPGPALYIYQGAGPYDVASFYDGDGVEVLHVGNANAGQGGKVGINESFPLIELTVRGSISASGYITVSGGNSNQWNNNYSTVSTNSGRWENVYTATNTYSGNWNTAYTLATGLTSLSSNWQNAYTTLSTTSATWVTYTALSTVSGNWQNASTTVNSNSGNWNTAYNISTAYASISSTYAATSFVQTNFLPLTGGTLTGRLSSNSSITTTSNVSASQATVTSLQLYDTGLGRYVTLTCYNGILTVT